MACLTLRCLGSEKQQQQQQQHDLVNRVSLIS
jgi:hypothetical protein